MEKEIFDQIVHLIIEKRGKYKFQITEKTTLEDDLEISGDDAIEFLEAFSDKFNVDISQFKFSEYFASEGSIDVWLGFFIKKSSRKPLMVLDLVNAVKMNILNP